MKRGLSQINREISYAKRRGMKKYFSKADAVRVYRRHKGRCALCGDRLTDLTAKFMLYIPFKSGGKVHSDNLILTCFPCKKSYSPIPRAKGRVEGYNSIPDIIVALVEAVKNNKAPEDIRIIKADLNAAISEFVRSLHYLPGQELIEKSVTPVIERENTIADLVEKATKDEEVKEAIQENLESISLTKKYIILRNPSED